ncbi:MAG: adenylate kinase [Thermodesulfobacteriota bacterium]
MILIIFGPPGAGKGTQAILISKNYNMIHISTGDILRSAVKEGTELGELAKSYMDNGELVPDDVVIGIIKDEIKKNISSNGFLLDGFPRTIPQAEALDRMLNSEQLKVNDVLSIEVTDEEIIKRISGRRVCEKCGAMYHNSFDPSREKGMCDNCREDLYQRDDDKEDVVRTRLQVYREQTEPLKQYYENADLLSEVDGLGTIEEVSDRIEKVLKSMAK